MVDTVSVKRCPEGSSACTASSARMSALQAKKQSIQDKLAARNEELRRLCIQEAELTGSMPPELPLEPGESPPPFRRVVGTGFAYPQNLINKLKTNDSIESIAALELEKQVQVGISEAALGLVHNGAASKAARRKNRLVYQQSQKRLSELDERLGFLMAAREQPLQQRHSMTAMKYKKKPRPVTLDVDQRQYEDNHSGHYSTHSTGPPLERPRHQHQIAPHQQYDTGLGGYWIALETGETVWCPIEQNYWTRETRFGSLDRSKTRPLQHKYSAPTTEERTRKQKKWYETSLDTPAPTGSLESMIPPHSPYHHSPLTTPTKTPPPPPRVPSMEYVPENTVPIQSPKNCTVIQPGQWKPYREVTKPFEMSDFYKYSTKFRNRNSNGNEGEKVEEVNGNDVLDSPQQVYHKGIYQPLQPQKCQPFLHNLSPNGMVVISENCPPSPHEMIQKKQLVPETSHMVTTQYGTLRASYSPQQAKNMPTSTLV